MAQSSKVKTFLVWIYLVHFQVKFRRPTYAEPPGKNWCRFIHRKALSEVLGSSRGARMVLFQSLLTNKNVFFLSSCIFFFWSEILPAVPVSPGRWYGRLRFKDALWCIHTHTEKICPYCRQESPKSAGVIRLAISRVQRQYSVAWPVRDAAL